MTRSDAPSTPLVRMSRIGKRFGSVEVLRDVDLELHAGEVLVVAGENGAGKSTLIKILGGVHPEFDGEIELSGRRAQPRSPFEANALGVAVIYQELSLIPSMDVADNIFLGRPIVKRGWVDDRAQRREARRILDRLGIDVDVTARVGTLSIARQQLTEIAKALSRDARVIVMDEPTSALNAPEVEKLFGIIADLKRRGCGIIYITHKMEEIERVADRITVLRDGRHVGTAAGKDLPPTKLVRWMVGREVDDGFPRHATRPGGVRLALSNFTVHGPRAGGRGLVRDVALKVHTGEILGIGGLQGSGATELFLALFGASAHRVEGEVTLNGQPLRLGSPRRAIDQGVALLTNDRKATGLVLPMSIVANATLGDLPRLCSAGWRRPRRELAATRALGKRLALRAPSLRMAVDSLSGGNQQKVALAKWLQTDPRLLLLDEPTRGIDVGAKREVYDLMNRLTARGIAIMLITSELPELLAMSDRIVVMHRGRLTAEFASGEATPEKILEAAMGRVRG